MKLLIGWGVVSVPVGVLLGRTIRLRERSPETRVPEQRDADLERDQPRRRAAG